MMNSKVHVICIMMLLAFLSISSPGKAEAGIDVNVNIGLPSFMISTTPEVVLIPGTSAYIIPDVDVDIIFLGGYWYRPHRGYWYRADSYNGPWINIARERVPIALMELPRDYRDIPPGQARIPYGQLKKSRSHKGSAGYLDSRSHKHSKGKGKHGRH